MKVEFMTKTSVRKEIENSLRTTFKKIEKEIFNIKTRIIKLEEEIQILSGK